MLHTLTRNCYKNCLFNSRLDIILHHKLKSTMKLNSVVQCARNFSGKSTNPSVCIVGSGPAGFYAAQQLIKV